MDEEKRDSQRANSEKSIGRATRPGMPPSYGLHPAGEGQDFLPWSWLVERLARARNYWLGTTRPDGRPHSVPIWGLWREGTLYFGSGRGSRKDRNLASNPEVVLHLESGDEVVILEGRVEEVWDPEELNTYADEYDQKYAFRPDPADPESKTYRFRPVLAFAWLEADFPRTATRWKLDPD